MVPFSGPGPILDDSSASATEELPSAKSPQVHEVIVRDLVTLGKLIDSQGESTKGTTPGLDDD